MGSIKKVFFNLLLLGYSFIGIAQQRPIEYRGEEKLEIHYDHIFYLPAGDSVFSLAGAQRHADTGNFKPNTKKYLNLGIAKDNYWIRMLLVNRTSAQYELIFKLGNPRINEADIYVVQKNSDPTFFIIGDKFNFKKRAIYYNQFAIPLTLKAADSLQIYMLLKHKGNTLQLPISLHTNNSFYKTIENNYLIIGVTAGILLLTFFFSLFLFIKSLNRLFIFYSLYLLSILLWLFSTEVYGFQYLWPNQPEWATRFGAGFSVFNLTTFIIVALLFTKPYDNTRWIRRVLYGIAVLTFLWGLQAFMPYINISSTTLMSTFLITSFAIYIIALTLLMTYLLYVSVKKNKLVYYYFFAVIVSVVFSLLVVARHSGDRKGVV